MKDQHRVIKSPSWPPTQPTSLEFVVGMNLAKETGVAYMSSPLQRLHLKPPKVCCIQSILWVLFFGTVHCQKEMFSTF